MKTKEAIKYLQQLYPYGGHCWLDKQRTEAIGMAIQALQEEPVSEDLQKAAEQDVCEVVNCCSATRIPNDHIPSWVQDAMVNEFIHGANWKKRQIMVNSADAVIGLPYENKDGGYIHLVDVSRPLPVGNNKIAIIFEEK